MQEMEDISEGGRVSSATAQSRYTKRNSNRDTKHTSTGQRLTNIK